MTHSTSLPTILTAQEVAQLLRVSRKTVYEAARHGELPGVLRIGRALRFHRDAILQSMSHTGLGPTTVGSKR